MGRKPNYDNYTLQRLIYDREDLTAIEKHLLCVIFWHRNHDNGECHPGIRKLRDRSGLSKTTITKYTRIAEQKNALAVERKPGRGGNRYYSPLDDERAREFANGSVPPQDSEKSEKQPTETREEPMPQDLDPPVAKLLEEIEALRITEATGTTGIRADILVCIEELREQGDTGHAIAKKFTAANVPRLRGGLGWKAADVDQLIRSMEKKQQKSLSPVESPPEEKPSWLPQMPDDSTFRNFGDRIKAFINVGREYQTLIGQERLLEILGEHGYKELTIVRKRDHMAAILADLERATIEEASEGPF
jgi:DNA-binding MarR family transcriptional regulator